MQKNSDAKGVRERILSEYYTNIYQDYLFSKDTQGRGIDYFEKSVEKYWSNKNPSKVLEIGGGSGEHLKYIDFIPEIEYISLDLRLPTTDVHTKNLAPEFLAKLRFKIGNAESLPFDDQSFDRIYSTCLLHHVDDVLAVLMEVRRVAQVGAEIAFLMPTDPGILNQIIKRIISYPKMRKLSKIRPQVFYALDHKNHIAGIIELIKFVFKDDNLQFSHKPFLIPSWNFNLLIVAKIIKS
jgi:ubiquinone/menaquinone biosynthesis C-methylase UbiE